MTAPHPWHVAVTDTDGVYRAVFHVGVQSFVLAMVDARRCDAEEAREHCRGIARMFLVALERAGMPGARERLAEMEARERAGSER